MNKKNVKVEFPCDSLFKKEDLQGIYWMLQKFPLEATEKIHGIHMM
jgi:hypothetical protein